MRVCEDKITEMFVTILLGDGNCAIKNSDFISIDNLNASFLPVVHQILIVVEIPLFWNEEAAAKTLTTALSSSFTVTDAAFFAAVAKSLQRSIRERCQ
jgi:hypothetical protein